VSKKKFDKKFDKAIKKAMKAKDEDIVISETAAEYWERVERRRRKVEHIIELLKELI
jgi:hypothetical protein